MQYELDLWIEESTQKKKALDLALSYSFSTMSVFRQLSGRDELIMQNCNKNVENNSGNN